MENGPFQVWATNTFQLNVTGQNRSMETTQLGSATPITGAQVRTQYQNNWTSTNGISFRTNPGVARTQGLLQLNNKAASALSADYPARSADPPIIIFFFSFNAVRIFSEDFLVASVSKFLIAFCFSILKISEKFLEKILSI